VTGRRGKKLLDLEEEKRILEIETGSTLSPSVENSLCKRLWNCHTTKKIMNEQGYSVTESSVHYIQQQRRQRFYEFCSPCSSKYIPQV